MRSYLVSPALLPLLGLHAVGLNTSYVPIRATGPLQLPPSAVGPLYVQQQQVVLQGDVPGNTAAPASVEVSGCTRAICCECATRRVAISITPDAQPPPPLRPQAYNGVIHTIDTVLLPSPISAPPAAAAAAPATESAPAAASPAAAPKAEPNLY